MIMDKSSRALSERIQIQMFNRLSDQIDICELFYYCLPFIILQVISSSLIFIGLAIATYKAYRGLLPS